MSDQSSDLSVVAGTIVKDLDDGAFYEFTGTAGEGQAITDLSGMDFANDANWQSHKTDLGTENYSDDTRWELENAPGDPTYDTADGRQSLLTGDTVKLADNGGQEGSTDDHWSTVIQEGRPRQGQGRRFIDDRVRRGQPSGAGRYHR